MTYQQILWAVDEAAQLAAESAVDAHGENPPPAEVAWEFLEQLYESDEIERPTVLPHFMPRQVAIMPLTGSKSASDRRFEAGISACNRRL